MSDRYVFAEACNATDSYGWATPAPSPEDWQAIVDAVEKYHDGADDYVDSVVLFADIARAAAAAVRNMREAERPRPCPACSGSGVDTRPGNAHGEPCIVCSGLGRVVEP